MRINIQRKAEKKEITHKKDHTRNQLSVVILKTREVQCFHGANNNPEEVQLKKKKITEYPMALAIERSLGTWVGTMLIKEWIDRNAATAAKSLQSCPTLCDPIDGSPPGSSGHGIF